MSLPVPAPFPSRLAGLDTLRAVAIVAVMSYHQRGFLPKALDPAARFGWAGVDLFFVLSGYLIGSQLLRPVRAAQPLRIAEFYRKRAFRILPAYLVVLALYLVWPLWHEDTGMSPLWQFLTFTENLFVDYANNHAFSHVWSLCVEEHFYLLLPWLVLLLAKQPSWRKTAAVLLAVLLFGIAARWWQLVHVLRPLGPQNDSFSTRYIERIYYPTYSRLDGLLAGVTLALLQTFRPARWQALTRYANLLTLAGASLVASVLFLSRNRFASATGAAAWNDVFGFPLLSVGLAMLVLAAATPGSWLDRARIPGARTVAIMAFSVYLTHKEVAHVLYHFLGDFMDRHPWRMLLVLEPACLLAGAALYCAVERPMLVLRDRRAQRLPAPDIDARIEPAL